VRKYNKIKKKKVGGEKGGKGIMFPPWLGFVDFFILRPPKGEATRTGNQGPWENWPHQGALPSTQEVVAQASSARGGTALRTR